MYRLIDDLKTNGWNEDIAFDSDQGNFWLVIHQDADPTRMSQPDT
ncbi:26001_t:CDS:2, partial [Gigaspora margarita]